MTRRAETAIDLVGRDVMKSLAVPFCIPRPTTSFEEVKGADDVRLNEIARACDRTIHVRFGRQVQDMRNRVALEQLQQGWLIAQIDFLEGIFGMLLDRSEILEMAGVSEAIEI